MRTEGAGAAETHWRIALRHLRFIKFLPTACGAVFLETTHAAFSSVGFWPGRVPKESMKSMPRSRRNLARSARIKSACVSEYLRGILKTLTGQAVLVPFCAGVSEAPARSWWQTACEIHAFLPASSFSADMCVSSHYYNRNSCFFQPQEQGVSFARCLAGRAEGGRADRRHESAKGADGSSRRPATSQTTRPAKNPSPYYPPFINTGGKN